MAENAQPIVIKRVKKVSGGGHHGGSWKVAYADFVTAMMAFFLLLWLLNVSNEEVLQGISSYFKNPQIVPAAGGASTSVIKLGKHVDVSKGDGERARQSDMDNYQDAMDQSLEKLQIMSLKQEIEYAVDTVPELNQFKDQLLIDMTEDGLRIQIVDKDKRPMFDSGSSRLKYYARGILKKLAPILNAVPNQLSISGHTDAVSFFDEETGYTNWELSTDRAHSARRQLEASGYARNKIARVAGMGDTVPYDRENPRADINRRISLLVMNKKAAGDVRSGDSAEAAIPGGPIGLPEKIKNAIQEGGRNQSGIIIRE